MVKLAVHQHVKLIRTRALQKFVLQKRQRMTKENARLQSRSAPVFPEYNPHDKGRFVGYDAIFRSEGDNYEALHRVLKKILRPAHYRTWVAANGDLNDKLLPSVSAKEIALRVGKHRRTIEIDLQQMRENMYLNLQATRRAEGWVMEMRCDSLFWLVHEYMKWERCADYIPPIRAYLEEVVLDPELEQFLLQFEDYRKVLAKKKPGPKSRSKENDVCHEASSLRQRHANDPFENIRSEAPIQPTAPQEGMDRGIYLQVPTPPVLPQAGVRGSVYSDYPEATVPQNISQEVVSGSDYQEDSVMQNSYENGHRYSNEYTRGGLSLQQTMYNDERRIISMDEMLYQAIPHYRDRRGRFYFPASVIPLLFNDLLTRKRQEYLITIDEFSPGIAQILGPDIQGVAVSLKHSCIPNEKYDIEMRVYAVLPERDDPGERTALQEEEEAQQQQSKGENALVAISLAGVFTNDLRDHLYYGTPGTRYYVPVRDFVAEEQAKFAEEVVGVWISRDPETLNTVLDYCFDWFMEQVDAQPETTAVQQAADIYDAMSGVAGMVETQADPQPVVYNQGKERGGAQPQETEPMPIRRQSMELVTPHKELREMREPEPVSRQSMGLLALPQHQMEPAETQRGSQESMSRESQESQMCREPMVLQEKRMQRHEIQRQEFESVQSQSQRPAVLPYRTMSRTGMQRQESVPMRDLGTRRIASPHLHRECSGTQLQESMRSRGLQYSRTQRREPQSQESILPSQQSIERTSIPRSEQKPGQEQRQDATTWQEPDRQHPRTQRQVNQGISSQQSMERTSIPRSEQKPEQHQETTTWQEPDRQHSRTQRQESMSVQQENPGAPSQQSMERTLIPRSEQKPGQRQEATPWQEPDRQHPRTQRQESIPVRQEDQRAPSQQSIERTSIPRSEQKPGQDQRQEATTCQESDLQRPRTQRRESEPLRGQQRESAASRERNQEPVPSGRQNLKKVLSQHYERVPGTFVEELSQEYPIESTSVHERDRQWLLSQHYQNQPESSPRQTMEPVQLYGQVVEAELSQEYAAEHVIVGRDNQQWVPSDYHDGKLQLPQGYDRERVTVEDDDQQWVPSDYHDGKLQPPQGYDRERVTAEDDDQQWILSGYHDEKLHPSQEEERGSTLSWEPSQVRKRDIVTPHTIHGANVQKTTFYDDREQNEVGPEHKARDSFAERNTENNLPAVHLENIPDSDMEELSRSASPGNLPEDHLEKQARPSDVLFRNEVQEVVHDGSSGEVLYPEIFPLLQEFMKKKLLGEDTEKRYFISYKRLGYPNLEAVFPPGTDGLWLWKQPRKRIIHIKPSCVALDPCLKSRFNAGSAVLVGRVLDEDGTLYFNHIPTGRERRYRRQVNAEHSNRFRPEPGRNTAYENDLGSLPGERGQDMYQALLTRARHSHGNGFQRLF